MNVTKLLTRIITMGMGISLLFTSTNVLAASPKYSLQKNSFKEIKSLTSEDYSDLAFLKPILKDKTVVSLGENFHRVAEYSSMKTRLIKYLHEELGFDVIAFESGIGETAAVNENEGILTPKEMMERSLPDIWQSKETLGLFDYIKQQRQTNRPLYLAGYDMQFTTGYITQFISEWISKVNKEYGKQYFDFEMQAMTDLFVAMNKYGMWDPQLKEESKKVKDQYEPKYKELIQFMNDNRVQLAAMYPNNPHMVDIAIKALEGQISFMEMFQYDTKGSYEFRDKIMADNVEWLTKVAYPGKKVILWAHNDHLAKNTSQIRTMENGKWINDFTSMGELLNKKLGDKEYVMGLYMNRGNATTITTRKPFTIDPMPKGSLENLIIQSGYENTFVDLSKQKKPNKKNDWMFKPIYAAEDGMTAEIIRPMSMEFIPKEQYDGIIVIDKVNAPTTNY